MVGQGKTNKGFFFLVGDSASLAGGRKKRRKIGSFTPDRKRSHFCELNENVTKKKKKVEECNSNLV